VLGRRTLQTSDPQCIGICLPDLHHPLTDWLTTYINVLLPSHWCSIIFMVMAVYGGGIMALICNSSCVKLFLCILLLLLLHLLLNANCYVVQIFGIRILISSFVKFVLNVRVCGVKLSDYHECVSHSSSTFRMVNALPSM